jgi:hypothetical protein
MALIADSSQIGWKEERMAKVYRSLPGKPDEYLGWIDPISGKVYQAQLGMETHIGNIDPVGGNISLACFCPDDNIGRVNMESGKIYQHHIGMDEYVGLVKQDGKVYRHIPFTSGEYLGQVLEMKSLAEGGAALLLFFLKGGPPEEPAKPKPKDL